MPINAYDIQKYTSKYVILHRNVQCASTSQETSPGARARARSGEWTGSYASFLPCLPESLSSASLLPLHLPLACIFASLEARARAREETQRKVEEERQAAMNTHTHTRTKKPKRKLERKRGKQRSNEHQRQHDHEPPRTSTGTSANTPSARAAQTSTHKPPKRATQNEHPRPRPHPVLGLGFPNIPAYQKKNKKKTPRETSQYTYTWQETSQAFHERNGEGEGGKWPGSYTYAASPSPPSSVFSPPTTGNTCPSGRHCSTHCSTGDITRHHGRHRSTSTSQHKYTPKASHERKREEDWIIRIRGFWTIRIAPRFCIAASTHLTIPHIVRGARPGILAETETNNTRTHTP
ncbi:hypothetical protein B0H13DRAFT_2370688 [Mycena leptocephala]|nr:hypothetical protein B0H13DRAFT_2370688 [Mycena leptocephala]